MSDDDYYEHYVELCGEVESWVARQLAADARAKDEEVERLRKALEWYAKASWYRLYHDRGEHAREALKGGNDDKLLHHF